MNDLLAFAVIVAAALVIFLGLRLLLIWQRARYLRREKHVILSIRVSKTNEKLPIVAEQMFSILHGILHRISFVEWLRGVTTETISFEVANVEGLIKFFAYTPAHLRDFVEGQIYAQYPDVEIEEVGDYSNDVPIEIGENSNGFVENERVPKFSIPSLESEPEGSSLRVEDNFQFLNNSQISNSKNSKDLIVTANQKSQIKNLKSFDYFSHALGAELTLADPHIYPIKRYAQLEDKLTRTAVDSLSGLTSVLTKLPHMNDRAMVQIVVRPLPEWWRIRATKCARILGKHIFFGIETFQKWYAWAFMTRALWPRIVFFPAYILFFFQGLFAGSKVSFSADAGGGEDVLGEITSRAHERESATDAMMDKVVKLPFDVSIRVVYVPTVPNEKTARTKVRELAGAFKQFNQPHLNGFKIAEYGGAEILRRFRERKLHEPFVLNVEELATVFHLPNIEVKTPNIYWVTSKKLEPPVDVPDSAREKDLTTLGKINYRGMEKNFGIRTEDRRRHIYIIGKTGMGKSTLLENMIISDIRAGKGLAIVDPHGDLADHVLDNIPSHRTNDVIVFDPSDREFPVAFNMLENLDPALNSVVASGLVGIFKKLYAESWGPRLEHILRNTILSLLEYPNTTMLGIPRILVDQNFRKRVVRKITDPIVKKFWEDEFEKMKDSQRVEAISPIQNKVGQFLSSAIIRNIVGQPKSMIDLRYAMDHKKIFVCNLSKGKIGEDNSSLLGSMIITKFQLDAMSRSNIPEKERVDFYLYVDEFQNFATDSFATILSEARKYRLNLTMANQYVAQMSEEVRDAVFGNVGTLMSFQVGFDDAEYISNQFSEIALPADLVQLPKYNLYTKLLIDGMPSQPFSAATLAPEHGEVDPSRREKVMRLSREKYAVKREIVEDKIRRWSESGARDEEQGTRVESNEGAVVLPRVEKKLEISNAKIQTLPTGLRFRDPSDSRSRQVPNQIQNPKSETKSSVVVAEVSRPRSETKQSGVSQKSNLKNSNDERIKDQGLRIKTEEIPNPKSQNKSLVASHHITHQTSRANSSTNGLNQKSAIPHRRDKFQNPKSIRPIHIKPAPTRPPVNTLRFKKTVGKSFASKKIPVGK